MHNYVDPFSLGYFFVLIVLSIAYNQDKRTDFHAKYAERHHSAQECAFWGVAKPVFKFPLIYIA